MKEKDLFYLVISIFVLSVLWIGFNIYNSFATSTIDEVLQEQITPINPTFDTATIEQLKKRESINAVTNFTPNEDAEAAELTPTPEASGSADLEEAEEEIAAGEE